MSRKRRPQERYADETVQNADLYRPGERSFEAKLCRRRVREHNFPLLAAAGKELARQPWFFGEYSEIPVEGLACNGVWPRPREKNRFRLRWKCFGEVPDLPDFVLELFDRRTRQVAADRRWSIYQEKQPPEAINFLELSSSSTTAMGYEGNGFGQALLGLSNDFIEAVFHHLELWPAENVEFIRNKQLYAVIYDAAKSRCRDMLDYQKQRITGDSGALAVTQRQGWTTDSAKRWLSNYVNNEEAVKKLLGWLPRYFDANYFVARYEVCAFGTLPAEEYFAMMDEARLR